MNNTVKRIILIYGASRSGKTYLADQLKTRYSLNVLSVDSCYVEFVARQFPELYFEALDHFIGPHYLWMRAWRPQLEEHFKREPIAYWQRHLLASIKEQSDFVDDLAVEGFLLCDFREEIENELLRRAMTFQVHVVDRKYFVQNNAVTVEQIAMFGKVSK